MESTTPALSGLEPLMSTEELSEYLNVPVRTLYHWRLAGKGPCAIRVGRQLRYFVADVQEWLRHNREVEPGRVPTGGEASWVGPAPPSAPSAHRAHA